MPRDRNVAHLKGQRVPSAGPVVGAIGNIFGIRQALAAAALILSPTLLLYGRAIKRGGAEPGLKEVSEK